MPVDMRRKGEDGLGQFGPALFACKALPFVSCKKKCRCPIGSFLVAVKEFQPVGRFFVELTLASQLIARGKIVMVT